MDQMNSDVIENDENMEPKEWKTNLFSVYSRVFKVMLSSWKETIEQAEQEERIKELEELVLPSNEEWRHQVYYRLVDLQRELDSGIEKTMDDEGDADDEDDLKNLKNFEESSPTNKNLSEWEPSRLTLVSPPQNQKRKRSIDSQSLLIGQLINIGSMTEACIEPGWRVNDIVLAAKVLQNSGENLKRKIIYSDEAEMRRVFGLVYDVLRYKQILNQTLDDADFWMNNKNLRKEERIVWLLLFDMQGRKFTKSVQTAVLEARERAFSLAGIQDIENALLDMKTRLSASVSRLRIGGSALTLDRLLPSHLRNAEGVCWSNNDSVASGWVNTIKIPSKSDFISEMKSLGLELSSQVHDLDENEFAFDAICPKVVILNDKAREKLAMSSLVKNNCFVFLERTLCLGAAALLRAVRLGRLCGPVILSHSIAPKHTGYLIGLLADVEDAGRLLAFGAGSQRGEYEEYLQELGYGPKEYRIFAEKYSDAPGFSEMERATVVLAAPPCSYTGLRDVVDLAVARGGDMDLLESLTNIDDQSQLERPRELLAEQLLSLKYALTRPNVQLLVYQTHSVLPSETTEMVEQVVQYVNKMATEKYAKEHPRRRSPKESSPKSGGRTSRSGKRSTIHQDSRGKSSADEEDEEDSQIPELQVPESDLFQIGQMSDLRPENSRPPTPFPDTEAGCYLGLIRRREMMQFNSLFMIKVAESKGLFGDPNVKVKNVEKEQVKEEPKSPTNEQKSSKSSKKKKSIRLDRITAPTHSSMIRSGSRGVSRQSVDDDSSTGVSWIHPRLSCPRYSQRIARDQCELTAQVRETRRKDARRWWEQSTTFLIHAARCESCKFRIFHTDPWTRRVLYLPRIQHISFNL